MPSPTREPRRVAAIVYDGLCTFEFGIVVEVFGLRRPELNVEWYDLSICSVDPGPIRAAGGITIAGTRSLGSLRRAGTIIVPGWKDADAPPPDPLIRALRRAHADGARLVSICSGVFVLAATGLLDGKRATTHWRYAERLAVRYPEIRVQPDVLYVDEGTILTSAGSAAGIDLCLHIVRRDYGAATANTVARRLVVAPHRDGGQAQFVERPMQPATGGGLARVLDWARRNLDKPLAVERLAREAAMAPRTFMRRFRQETGTTPHQWLLHQRLLAAQHYLETSSHSIDRISEAVGLGTAATLRNCFRQTLRVTPTAYRRRFSTVKPRRRTQG